jgi:hypothetical protein
MTKKKEKGYSWASYPVFGPYSLSLGLVGQISNHAAHADPPLRCFITDAWAPWRVVSFLPPPTGNRLPYLAAGCARATPSFLRDFRRARERIGRALLAQAINIGPCRQARVHSYRVRGVKRRKWRGRERR